MLTTVLTGYICKKSDVHLMYITKNVHEIYLRTALDVSACTSHVHWYIHLTYIEKIKMYIMTYIVIKCTLDVHI